MYVHACTRALVTSTFPVSCRDYCTDFNLLTAQNKSSRPTPATATKQELKPDPFRRIANFVESDEDFG